ncbi:hypothetical protein V8D89_004544 [Ganoderma adspersum]
MATRIIDHRASRPRLPFDVQLVVAENCPDVPTLLALVSSHRTLREHGARLALQLPTARVRLHTEPALHSFFHFVAPLTRIEGLPARLTHLHTLDISLGIVRAASVEALTTMLGHVPELSSLTLREPEAVLTNSAALYAALQRLATLKSLRAFAAGPATRKLVQEVASSLENVALIHGPTAILADGFLELDTVLGPHRDSLTRVHASRATPFARGDPGAETVVFENVRELVIDEFAWDTAPHFLDAFPNVVSLDLGMAVTAHWKLSPVLVRLREANRFFNGGTEDSDSDDSDTEGSDGEEEEEEGDDAWNSGDSDSETEERDEVDALLEMDGRGRMGEHNGVGTHPQAEAGGNDQGDADDEESLAWESLEHVRGGLLDLYVFGNSCEVDVLTIDGLVHDSWAWACVPAVVHDHWPRTLRLEVSSSLDAEAWEIGWKDLGSVRALELKIVVEDLFDEEQLMDNAARANEATCHQLNSFDHKEFACRVFERSGVPTALQICVHTPSRATIWNFDPPVGVNEEDDGMEVRPVLSEEVDLSAP